MRREIKSVRIANVSKEYKIGDTINGEIVKYIHAGDRDGRIFFILLCDKPEFITNDEVLKYAILQVIPAVDDRVIIEFYQLDRSN